MNIGIYINYILYNNNNNNMFPSESDAKYIAGQFAMKYWILIIYYWELRRHGLSTESQAYLLLLLF